MMGCLPAEALAQAGDIFQVQCVSSPTYPPQRGGKEKAIVGMNKVL